MSGIVGVMIKMNGVAQSVFSQTSQNATTLLVWYNLFLKYRYYGELYSDYMLDHDYEKLLEEIDYLGSHYVELFKTNISRIAPVYSGLTKILSDEGYLYSRVINGILRNILTLSGFSRVEISGFLQDIDYILAGVVFSEGFEVNSLHANTPIKEEVHGKTLYTNKYLVIARWIKENKLKVNIEDDKYFCPFCNKEVELSNFFGSWDWEQRENYKIGCEHTQGTGKDIYFSPVPEIVLNH